ncbi:MAG TPA: CARDB domain-containing protein, partial [Acidobacteriota bacterium]|nr:CARDB domain-containing protein [Acidobacteriota bacterium]
QTLGYDPSWHTFIRAAVITSPIFRNISVTHVDAPTIVNRGDTVSGRANVNVTVQNNGMMTESFFDVWVCAEGVEFGRQSVVGLASGAQITITFPWNTTGYTWGNYTIEAYAENLIGETTYGDNYLLYGDVLVKLIGDLGSRVGSTNTFGAFDGAVTSTDLSLFLQCYKGIAPLGYMYLGDLGSRVGSTNTFFAYDGSVTSTDLSLFLICFKGGGP